MSIVIPSNVMRISAFTDLCLIKFSVVLIHSHVCSGDFGLFDNSSSAMDRKSLASALSAIPRPDTNPLVFKPGKLPDIPLLCNIKECVGSNFCVNEEGDFYPSKTLATLVSAKSYLLFNLLGIEDLSWHDAPVALWPCFPTYTRVKIFVDQLLIVNDGAERGM